MTLYHVAWCPDCEVVRQKLADLHIEYDHVIVPDIRPMRTVVKEVSGQYYVPVLKDGDRVLTEAEDILDYLDKAYGQERIADNSPPRQTC
jgi:glutathione S-transferase